MDSTAGKSGSIAVVADDLTGACDAAVHFAAAGLATYVGLHFDDAPPVRWQAYAVNTDTRCSSRAEAEVRAGRACALARQLRPARIVKKIDSLMRGNIAAEIAAARAALGTRITLLAPAFPALGRTVRSGRVYVDGEREPIAMENRLEGLRCAIVPRNALGDLAARCARAIEQQIDVLIPDTENEDDVRRLAQIGAGIEGLLWVGSGGLAKAVASTIGRDATAAAQVRRAAKPLLVCAGSSHSITQAQLEDLRSRQDVAFAIAGEEGYREANAAIGQGRNAALIFERAQLNAAALRVFAEGVQIKQLGGLVLTGGDTAIRILEVLGATSLRSIAEILPGIPQGEIVGGAAAGLLLATKSGAFGAPDALSRCVETLRAPLARADEDKILGKRMR